MPRAAQIAAAAPWLKLSAAASLEPPPSPRPEDAPFDEADGGSAPLRAFFFDLLFFFAMALHPDCRTRERQFVLPNRSGSRYIT